MGKLYERLVLSRLKNFVHNNNTVIDEQLGFRPKHSCIQQVHCITVYTLHYLNNYGKSHPTEVLFLDVTKAFDKVQHDGLIYKLYNYGIPDRLVHIIRD